MTAPVVGSGSCPACTQRVAKSSWFLCIPGAFLPSGWFVMAGLVPAIHVLPDAKDVDARPKAGHDGQYRLPCDPEIVDQVKARGHSEELIAIHDHGDIVLAKQRREIGNRRICRNRLEPRRHDVLYRPRKHLVGIALGEKRTEHITLI